MRLSSAYIPTQKEIPSDAQLPSHRLMIRAGLVRLLAAGVYSYLPLGWRIIKKIMNIVREEMDRIGGQELFLPMLNPIELWDETGRNQDFGDEMFRLFDRKQRQYCLAPTHEEIICDLARKYIRSYKDMPQIWYQIQTKFRDEPRPRSGLLRTRQFLMKDSYTLDCDDASLDEGYNLHAEAYRRIFSRCGLDYVEVGASSGLMGGSGSEEFMAESESGEDRLALCSSCDYAANLDIAVSKPDVVEERSAPLEIVDTPGKRTIQEVADFLNVSANNLMKSLLFISDGGEAVMALIRGDHEVNEIKLQNHLGCGFRPAHPDEVKEICEAEIGFIGPIGLNKVRIIADTVLKKQLNVTSGANINDKHYRGIDLARDVKSLEYADLRQVMEGQKCLSCGDNLRIVNAIELGHIFKLGIKYSASMGATYLDEHGKEHPIVMGSYGIGMERIMASFIEQNHDENGICWHPDLAPYLVHVIPVKQDDENIKNKAEEIYTLLNEQSIDTLLDDRTVSPGVKFKDADLLGMPIQVIIGKTLQTHGKFEIKTRKDGEKILVDPETLIPVIKEILDRLRS